MEEKDAIIELKHIVKRFFVGKSNEMEILHGIDLQVEEGEFLSIIGESGSGKSTLMNIIGALDRPTEGEYRLADVDVCQAKDKLWIFSTSIMRNREKPLFSLLTRKSWQRRRRG